MSIGTLRTQHPAQGFALLAAIFLLVVLGMLAYYLMSLSGTQQFTRLWAVQGARAHYAAQSGLQWGAYQAINGGGCNGTQSVNAGAATSLTVLVSCNSSQHKELGVTTTVWEIRATARIGSLGEPGFVQRTMLTTVSEP